MFESQNLLIFLNAGIILLSVITLFDVLLKFKGPFVLKFYFLIIASGIGVYSFGQLFIIYHSYSRILTEIPTQVTYIAFLNLIFKLYNTKLSKYILLLSIIIILIFIFIPLSYNNMDIYSLDSLNLYTNKETRSIYIISRIIANVFLTVVCIILLYKTFYKFNEQNLYYNKIRNWIIVMLILLIISFFMGILKFMYEELPFFKFASNAISYLGPLIFIIYRPDFFNKIPKSLSFYKVFSSPINYILFSEQFTTIFFTNLYYIKEKCNAIELSELLGVNKEFLYEFIKTNYNVTFTDLVNKQRILYFADLALLPQSKLLTIETLAKQSGFSSRQNMSKFFKKFHGGNPSDIINIEAD